MVREFEREQIVVLENKILHCTPLFFCLFCQTIGEEGVLSKGLRDYVCQSVGEGKEDGHEKKKGQPQVPSAH